MITKNYAENFQDIFLFVQGELDKVYPPLNPPLNPPYEISYHIGEIDVCFIHFPFFFF